MNGSHVSRLAQAIDQPLNEADLGLPQFLAEFAHAALQIARPLGPWLDYAVAWAARVEASEPTPGYTPLFAQEGKSFLEAQFLAMIILHLSLQMEHEQAAIRAKASSIRRIATGRSTQEERALLLQLLDGDVVDLRATVLDENAPGGNLDVTPLREALIDAAAGTSTVRHVAVVAAALLPRLPETRGRLRSRSHFAHALLLSIAAEGQGSEAYTYDPIKGQYTDPRTLATREAMSDPTFNPVRVRKDLRRIAARRT